MIPLALALFLVAINGFFVAAEFAFIKVRPNRLEELASEGGTLAGTAKWLAARLDGTLAACQLGITMASLALGWVGEPAFAVLVEPILAGIGVESPVVIHSVAFVIAFTAITGLHLVVGEQFPKIFALRRPEPIALLCALPLRGFYIASFPLLIALSSTTSLLLRLFGVENAGGHEAPQTEDEIRLLVRQARAHGNLSRTEDRLIDAVFEFDDMVCRRVMVARHQVEYFEADSTVDQCLELVRGRRHTRYPVCYGSLDKVIGVVHLKDLVVADNPEDTQVKTLVRPPRYVPETVPISRLLRHFQASRQHMAFVVDEHGTVTGIVTLENVIEQIVGPVEDEFDAEEQTIVPQGDGEYLVLGRTPIEEFNEKTGLELSDQEVDTISGLVTAHLGRIPETGDRVDLGPAIANVLMVSGSRAEKLKIVLTNEDLDEGSEG